MEKPAIIEMLDMRINKVIKLMNLQESKEPIAIDIYGKELDFLRSIKDIITETTKEHYTLRLDRSELERLGDCIIDGIAYALSHKDMKDKADYEMLMKEITRQTNSVKK